MKKLFYFILILSISTNAQEFENIVINDFCKCFGKNIKENQDGLSLLETCMVEIVRINEKKFNEYAIKNIDTSKIDGQTAYEYRYEYGQELFSNVQKKLIDECDSYYSFTTNLSQIMLKNVEKGTNQKKVDSLTNLIDHDSQNINLIWERGATKIGLNKYKSAQQDFNTCLAKDPNFIPALFFIGWSYHLEEDYENAIKFYEKLLSQKSELGGMGTVTKIYLATIKRKLREEK